MNSLLALAIIFGSYGAHHHDTEYEVFTGTHLPMWSDVCTDTGVYGDPNGLSEEQYSVSVGTRVRLHELSKPDGSWVMIKPAQWIPLSALCWARE